MLNPLQVHLTLKVKSSLTLKCVYLYRNEEIMFRTKAFHMTRFKPSSEFFVKDHGMHNLDPTFLTVGTKNQCLRRPTPCLSHLRLT